MRKELQRKLIHVCSLSIPIAYYWLTRDTALWILVPLTLVSFLIEILRVRVAAVDRLILQLVGSMLRPHESAQGTGRISGATWVLLSATLCVVLFPKPVTITAFSVLIVSDTAAALVGRAFGRHRYQTKSVEGSAAFLLSAVAVVAIWGLILEMGPLFYGVGLLAAVVSMLAEAVSYGAVIDDNLTIPLSFGVVLWGGLTLLG